MTLISSNFEYNRLPIHNRKTDNLLELFPTKFGQWTDIFPSKLQIKALRMIIKFQSLLGGPKINGKTTLLNHVTIYH